MAPIYRYAILQLVPFAYRDEAVNVGVVVLRADDLDVHLNASPALLAYFGVDPATLDWIADSLRASDTPESDAVQRVEKLSSIAGARLSQLGWFKAEDQAQYIHRISEILQQYVEKPQKIRRTTKQKSLQRDLKEIFKEYRLYSRRQDDIFKHKIVPNFPVGPSGKLHIDFLLKNGSYHATETIDFRNSHESGSSELKNAALANVTFNHAKNVLGLSETRCYLVYAASSPVEIVVKPAIEIAASAATKVFNVESRNDKLAYLDLILAAAGNPNLFDSNPT